MEGDRVSERPVEERRRADAALPTEVGEMPLGVRRAASWTWRILLIGAGIYALFWAGGYLSFALVPLSLALLLTVFLSPLVRLIDRYTFLNRSAAAIVSMIATVVVLVGMVTLAGRQIAESFQAISESFLQAVDFVIALLEDNLQSEAVDLAAVWDQVLTTLENNAQQILTGTLTTVGSTASVVMGLFTGIFLMIFALFFFLSQGEQIWRFIVGMLPPPARTTTFQATRRGWHALGAYARSQALVALVDAIGIAIGTFIAGIGEYAIPIGLVVFLFSFIPIVGAVISGFLACILALFLVGWQGALIMLVVVLVVQQLEGNVLQPWIMGSSVNIHPLAILLGVSVGSALLGIVGALFAVPVVAFVNAFVRYVNGTDMFPELDADDEEPDDSAAETGEVAEQRVG
jgi:putative heme transporter